MKIRQSRGTQREPGDQGGDIDRETLNAVEHPLGIVVFRNGDVLRD